MFASKFKLSQQPLLGEWTIEVHISGKYNMNKEYKFKVEHYVLPKFSVHIEHDRYIPEAVGVIRAIVYGKYTYGKYVQGTVEVLLQDVERTLDNAIKQTVEIDNGEVKAELFLARGKLIYSSTLYINATLKEKYSNLTATTESVVEFKHNRYNLLVPDSDIEFRDGNPYRMKLYVKNWDGTPVRDRSTPAKMSFYEKQYSAHLDENGVAQFEFEHKTDRYIGFSFKDSTLDVSNSFVELSSYDTDTTSCHLVMRPRR